MFSEHRLGLENELRSEREQRQNLQKALQREQDNSTELRTQLQQLQGLHSVSISQTHTQPVSGYTCSDLNRRIIVMEKNVYALKIKLHLSKVKGNLQLQLRLLLHTGIKYCNPMPTFKMCDWLCRDCF